MRHQLQQQQVAVRRGQQVQQLVRVHAHRHRRGCQQLHQVACVAREVLLQRFCIVECRANVSGVVVESQAARVAVDVLLQRRVQ